MVFFEKFLSCFFSFFEIRIGVREVFIVSSDIFFVKVVGGVLEFLVFSNRDYRKV